MKDTFCSSTYSPGLDIGPCSLLSSIIIDLCVLDQELLNWSG